jgi:hypothetical protein
MNDSVAKLQGQIGVGFVGARRGRRFRTREVADGSEISATRWSSRHYAFPFGQIATSHNFVFGKSSNHPNIHHSTLTFIPPPWLSYLALHWEFCIRKFVGGLPRMTVSLSAVRYNPSPQLKAAITNFDVPELQRLFQEGLARPTDQVVFRRPIPLLEVSYPSHLDATVLYNFIHAMIRPSP